MPCDETPSYGVDDNSPLIIADESCRGDKEKILNRPQRRHFEKFVKFEIGGTDNCGRNNIIAMAPKPLNEKETTNFTASCSSSSSSYSSFDRPRRNESTNSSSSLILILERPESNELLKNGRIEKNLSGSEKHDFSTEERRKEAPPVGLSSKVATSSLENLARKRANSTRCRRKRSSASPRNNYRNRTLISEKMTNEDNHSMETSTTGFVATSTLMKNRDYSALSISTNSSRSAEKVRLQSSVCTNSTALSKNHERDFTISTPEMRNHATIESQQSTISVAAIRGTNLAFESHINDNKNNRNNFTNVGANFQLKVQCVPSASAPSLNNNYTNNSNNKNNRVTCLTHASSSPHSTSSHSSSVVPLAVASSSLSSFSSQRSSGKTRKKKKTSETLTTSALTRTSPVRPAAPSYVLSPASPGFPTEKSSTSASLARVDSAISLKSSLSFTSCRVMRNNRVTTSIHASLGQLPINSSCATSATTATADEATSLENTENKNNADSNFAPITLYSTNTTAGNSKNFSSNAIAKNSLERVAGFANGASTMSSSSSRTPLQIVALPEIGNSTNNVVNSFRNSLITSANSNNNNHNNGRCNHSSGICTGACSGTTITSQTSSTLTRTPNIIIGVATPSSWTNNSAEQETDYVVDPVQGNAYHKGQFLGKGGFARVYLMTDVANGNQYACKIIPKNRMQKIHIQKIAREIMIHKELNHVNVVQMHHYFEDNINVYMLLEPCPRKSLMHVLKYRGKVTEPEARYYMKQMVTGVAYIHSQKVVHRDLKPGNMFLSDGMIVKIGDFGLATRPDGQRRRVTICGTPNYIAPEVLYKQAYSYEADVWALGCILYALLAGQPPFDTATLKETYARICNNRYKKLDDSVVSRSGEDLIRWLLQPIPELRPSLERVKEHAYLTVEYVPTKLPHTCCYRTPALHSIIPDQTTTMINTQNIGLLGNSMISRGIVSTENIDRSKREIASAGLITKNQHLTSNVTTTMSQAHLDSTRMKNLPKKPKVGNWLFRKLPKLPRFRQRLTKLLCPDNKKPDSIMMHRALESCLAEIRCTRTLENPMLVDRIVPLFVTKWIDYSNKYGLGFQLSDRSVGVLFNDSTKMSYTHDRTRVEYATTDDEVTRYRREKDVPSSMEEKLELLRHFTHYMDNFLTNGGEVKEQRTTKFSRTNSSSVPRMRRWLRTDKAIVMELTVPLLQVNFFIDHSKIVVSEGTRGRGYLVTYIDASRQASSYWLNDLRDVGCTTELYERLNYVCKVIAELENDAIFESTNATVTNNPHGKTLRT